MKKTSVAIFVTTLFVQPAFGSKDSEWETRASAAVNSLAKIGQKKSKTNAELCRAFLDAAFVPHSRKHPGNSQFVSIKQEKTHRTLHLKSLKDADDASQVVFVYEKGTPTPSYASITRLSKGAIVSVSLSSKHQWVINDDGCIWVINIGFPALSEVSAVEL